MITVTAGILMEEDKILICQRKRDDSSALKWEFPGGKVEEGEDPRAGLNRELKEELGIEATVGPEVWRTSHTYPGRPEFHLIFFAVPSYSGVIVNKVFEQMLWVERARLAEFDFLDADQPLVAAIASGEII